MRTINNDYLYAWRAHWLKMEKNNNRKEEFEHLTSTPVKKQWIQLMDEYFKSEDTSYIICGLLLLLYTQNMLLEHGHGTFRFDLSQIIAKRTNNGLKFDTSFELWRELIHVKLKFPQFVTIKIVSSRKRKKLKNVGWRKNAGVYDGIEIKYDTYKESKEKNWDEEKNGMKKEKINNYKLKNKSIKIQLPFVLIEAFNKFNSKLEKYLLNWHCMNTDDKYKDGERLREKLF